MRILSISVSWLWYYIECDSFGKTIGGNWAKYTRISLLFLITESESSVTPLTFSILCDLMDYSPPGSSDHGILQARVLEWVAIPFSRESSQPRD